MGASKALADIARAKPYLFRIPQEETEKTEHESPFSPGAGSPAPELVGRSEILEQAVTGCQPLGNLPDSRSLVGLSGTQSPPFRSPDLEPAIRAALPYDIAAGTTP